MAKIKFVDLNKSLVDKVAALGITAVYNDYFTEAYKTNRPVLMTASNPMFTFGGGIDAKFAEQFPGLIAYKKWKQGGQERIANIVFCITVDDYLRGSRELVKEAVEFSIANTDANETLLMSGIGTGIGGLEEDVFVEILKEVIA